MPQHRSTTTAVAPHGDTFRHVARRRGDGWQRCLVRGALRRAAPRVAPPHHPAERGGDVCRRDGRGLAITPDGTRVVYVGANDTALFVRPLDQLDATSLTGLGGPYGPFVSPDGQWIGFFDGFALKKVAITGGPAVTLGPADGTALGASWGPDGTIIFATNDPTTGLQRIAVAGANRPC